MFAWAFKRNSSDPSDLSSPKTVSAAGYALLRKAYGASALAKTGPAPARRPKAASSRFDAERRQAALTRPSAPKRQVQIYVKNVPVPDAVRKIVLLAIKVLLQCPCDIFEVNTKLMAEDCPLELPPEDQVCGAVVLFSGCSRSAERPNCPGQSQPQSQRAVSPFGWNKGQRPAVFFVNHTPQGEAGSEVLNSSQFFLQFPAFFLSQVLLLLRALFFISQPISGGDLERFFSQWPRFQASAQIG